MGRIYVGQTALRITLKCHCDISGALATKIKVKKPGEEDVVEWDASVADTEDGEIYYDITSTDDLNMSGLYKLWSYITFANSMSAPGETVHLQIYTEGD
jgi:hypothetical protein